MPLRVGVVCCTAIAATWCTSAEAATPLSGGGYSYLVTAGRMFRVLSVARVTGAEGKDLGTLISYAGESRAIARIVADAEVLVSALGPETEMAGETALMIRAAVGCDYRRGYFECPTFTVVYQWGNGRWIRAPDDASEPKELKRVDGPPEPPDDPSFPFDPAGNEGAAAVAAKWLALMDAGDVDGTVAAMTAGYRAQASSEQWRERLARRGPVGIGAERLELYRMQTRKAGVLAGAARVLVQYELRPAKGGRFLETVWLLHDAGAWRPAGYALQPISSRERKGVHSRHERGDRPGSR